MLMLSNPIACKLYSNFTIIEGGPLKASKYCTSISANSRQILHMPVIKLHLWI